MRLATLAVALVVVSLAGHAQEPVFRAGVDLVTVDAIVVDKDGRPVTGLTADDFILTVDGKPRTIDAFELVAVRATDAPADQRLPDVSSNDVAEPGRLIFLVIDRNNMRLGEGRAPLDGLKALVENLSPRDRLGLVTLPGGGPMIQPTSDHGAVLEALGRVRGMEAQNPDPTLLMTISEALRIERNVPGAINKVVERNCVGAGQAALEEVLPDAVSGKLTAVGQCQIRIQTAAGAIVREVRARNNASLAAMDALLDSLRDVEARKTIVYISDGLVFDQQLQGLLRLFGSRVAAAAVNFYAIQLYSPVVVAMAQGMPTDAEEDRNIRADGLFYLAGITGGALFRPSAGLGLVAARIARETSARYAIGFQVQPSERDGKRHEIKVALRRERGVTVRHRTEFTAEPRSRRLGKAPETLAAALSAPVMLQAVPLRVATTLVPDGSTQPKVLMAAAVGASALTGRYARTRLAYEVLDGDGRRYGETEEVDAVTPLYTVALRLRPGRYRVKVAAKDSEGRIGSVEHPFEVTPSPAEGIHVGGALLFRDTGEASDTDPAGRRAGRAARDRRPCVRARRAGRGDGRHRRQRRGHAPRRAGEPLQWADGHHLRQGGHRLRARRELPVGALARRPLSRRRGRAQGRRRRSRDVVRTFDVVAVAGAAAPATHHHDRRPRPAPRRRARRCSTPCCPGRRPTPTATRRAPCRRSPRSATSRPSSTAR